MFSISVISIPRSIDFHLFIRMPILYLAPETEVFGNQQQQFENVVKTIVL